MAVARARVGIGSQPALLLAQAGAGKNITTRIIYQGRASRPRKQRKGGAGPRKVAGQQVQRLAQAHILAQAQPLRVL